MIRLLGLSGSLRAASINTALLHAAAELLPEGTTLDVLTAWSDLPPFSPDLETADPPPPGVQAFRAALSAASGVLIACPEYAHGLPGAFKNALDWVVGSGELSGKPVLTLNAAPNSHHAQAALLEVLRTMDARPVSGSPWAVPGLHRRMTAPDVLAHAEAKAALEAAILELTSASSAQMQP
ncbi:NAD(P)H-dependent oxidoreductase [Deinococcus sp. KNUC1210]|uniref:NADPH-dependent FMN reductase n=1 Tax=Deinococcus sp. KNUC1210 TaxID=2917691 RepID=UPI001EF0F0F0|nr:NADPH-dependent FMN reductase [Deinococcus sp. KNUC1210]ULH16631.1 NAD(P)H-dependent oxidoreductase [Deinococcus sp. KNUC1210]